MNCAFEPTIRRHWHWCSVCGQSKEATPDPQYGTEIIYANCPGRTPAWRPKPGGYGLGDFIAWIIKRIGFGKSKTCGCDGRQAALNRLWNVETFKRRVTNPREAWRDLRTAVRKGRRRLGITLRPPSRPPARRKSDPPPTA